MPSFGWKRRKEGRGGGGTQRSPFSVPARGVKRNMSPIGRHGQMEEPEQNSRFNHCILVLAMGFLASISLHSGSQTLVPGVSAFHMFCKRMSTASASFSVHVYAAFWFLLN